MLPAPPRESRNKNTRIAYYHAIGQFLDWCQRAGFRGLEDIEPITVAAYVEQHPGSPATIKQHMSAIRMLFSWLTEKGILAMNPAREVKTEKFSRREGKTPAFDTEQVQKVLDKIDTSNEVGLRDRALLGTLAYTFARIGAVVNLKVEDYFQTGKRSMIRFSEKGGKETEIPVHHKLEELLDQYLETSGLRNRPNAPLFPIALGKTRKLGKRPATRIDAARMLKRRLKDAGLSDAFSPHSFRATGITNFLENGGTLEVAQRIAGHADSRTTTTAAARRSWSKIWSGSGKKRRILTAAVIELSDCSCRRAAQGPKPYQVLSRVQKSCSCLLCRSMSSGK
jgi:site-specific recombinase XerD